MTVRSPKRLAITVIEDFIREKKDWIITKQSNLKNRPEEPKPKEYISGEKFQFLGNEYELEIQQGLRNKIFIEENKLIISSTHPSKKDKIKKRLQDWYKEQARLVFDERLIECLEIAKKINVEFNSQPKLRRMKSRWGSCSSKGEVTLNTNLVSAPIECIDYVILHELCHLREMNHSKKFHALMDIVMPDWKRVKKLLNKSTNIQEL